MFSDSRLSTIAFRSERLCEIQQPPIASKDDLSCYLRNSIDDTSSSKIQPSKFQFILNALTSPSSKINEETTTYLNQDQPYELKFSVNNNQSSSTSVIYRSILCLCFWDKALQTRERDLFDKWVKEYKTSKLFDIDMNSTYGILSIIHSKTNPNAVAIVWDSSTLTSLFIRFKCTSTDFSQKRHGGEKGVPLRIQIDTYQEESHVNNIKHLYSCCCKIQLFRLKGAQRKNKADQIRLAKLDSDQRRHYQDKCDYTVFQSCSISPLYTLDLLSHSSSLDDLFDINIQSINHQVNISNEITTQSTNKQVLNWLFENNFSTILNKFQYFTGVDILRLSLDDIRRICDNDESISIRLYHHLNRTAVAPLKSLYIKVDKEDRYSAIYLHALSLNEFKEKLFQFIQKPKQNSSNMFLEMNRIKVKIDHDDVVKYTLPNEGQFDLNVRENDYILQYRKLLTI